MLGRRRLTCPGCGGPIELGLGSSTACVCPWCRASVARTDRDPTLLGKVADLVPTAPFLAVGDRVTLGGEELLVGGRVQLDHGQGPWDELYVERTRDGRWAWLASAQGKVYLTEEADGSAVPPLGHMTPGSQGRIPGAGEATWTVAEQGRSRLVSAEGELPFAVVPGQEGRYVDLVAPGGGFATIDYGDGSATPRLYVGREHPRDALRVVQEAVGPRPEEVVPAARLTCPACGAPAPIRAPELTERAVCASCYAELDFARGALSFTGTRAPRGLQPLVPLGAEGTLFGENLTVIGFMERSTAEGDFFWREYLLHAPGGYRWLVEDQNHFTWVAPINPAEVEVDGSRERAEHAGRAYRRFHTTTGVVRHVVGEFYWRVAVGERAELSDFIAPPHILSEERTGREVLWSAGEYVPSQEVWRAFGLPGSPPRPTGVVPSQPNPHPVAFTLGVASVALFALLVLAGAFELLPPGQLLVQAPLAMPATQGEPTEERNAATVTEPFTIEDGPTPVRVELLTSSDNQWIGVACALIEEDTGDTREFFAEAGYFHGRSGGESWSEGSRSSATYLSRVPAGTYALRLDPQWQHYPQPGAIEGMGLVAPRVDVDVRAGKRSPMCLSLAAAFVLLPLVLTVLFHRRFEQRRREG